MAGERDLSEEGQFSESQMMDIARGRVESFKLDMRIMKAEAQMGGNKVIVYFSSPGRVDFRDLVKDLAGALRSRVELKQVGARDEAKLVGGLGICGREYCCSSFLRDFVPVSIKMAKNQNLALNPSKVSGGCGRLLCCLTYENDAYFTMATSVWL
jgi:cell fate regulator YaaT (PSP1 superfamily)